MLQFRGSRLCLPLSCVVLFATAAFAYPPPDGKGGGKGGGGEDPPPEPELPPIEYLETKIALPAAGVQGARLNRFNELGMIGGYYYFPDQIHDRRAYLYDPGDPLNPYSAIDLNELAPVGLHPDWIIRSVVGMNNNGLVVGYISLFDDVTIRRGFVMDLAADPVELYTLPDDGWGWVDTYARNVNDNGDILGVFQRADLSKGVYLFNPGLRGGDLDADLEVLDINAYAYNFMDLSNPLPGAASKIVVELAGGGIAEYTRGGSVNVTTDPAPINPVLNANGDVAAHAYVETVVPINKKKSEIVSEWALYRDFGMGAEVTLGGQGSCDGMNNSGTVVLTGYGSSLGKYLYHDDWGFLDLYDLTSADHDLSGNIRMNEVGVDGFSQLAVGGTNTLTGETELVILTPSPTETSP